MTSANHVESQQIIDQIKAHIRQQKDLTNAHLLEEFAQVYFQSSAAEDLKKHTISGLYHRLLSHWQYIYERRQGEAKIKVINPSLSVDGFETTHTVIQVSHDDIPFLVDTIRMAINEHGYEIHFIIHFGGLKLKRDAKHRITEILPITAAGKEVSSEAPIYIEIDHIADAKHQLLLTEDIERVLADVRVAVADWRKMVAKVEDYLVELENSSPELDVEELAESKDFLRWVINNNFTFLGCRDYKLIGDGKMRALQLVPDSGLGVLRDESQSKTAKIYANLPPQARKMALSKNILIIAKTNTLSTIHRRDYTDYIGVKQFDAKGELIGERRFIGLYTSSAYHSSPRAIPFLRHKVEKVLENLGLPPDSHDGKESVHILETLPRDDLFQATHEDLVELTRGILQLKERKKIKLLVRRDAYYRYFSCLVYVPREIFTSVLAVSMQEILMKYFNGTDCNFTTYFSDSVLARLHFLVRVNPKIPLEYDVQTIENELIAVSRSWFDELKTQLIEKFGESLGLQYITKYTKAFPGSYTETYLPTEALSDIDKIESLSENVMLGMTFSKGSLDRQVGLKLYQADQTIVLSDALPIFENMGLRIIGESPHEIKRRDNKRFWINDFNMMYASNKEININEVKDIFQEAFRKIWFGDAENDGLNRLILECHLNWHEVAMLRAYTKYLRQTGFTFSQNYVEQALITNVEITKSLVQLFNLKFNPKTLNRDAKDLVDYIHQTLDTVSSLDEDKILRRILEVIQATLRTNYFQITLDGHTKSYLSFKFDPNRISDLPLPRPKYEIFVYSPRVEGVHLRFGKVARGGLRWSDRREDYRTEVLGLAKAQQVKNTVIVPEGAKGGFVLKQTTPEMNREQIQSEGVAGYSIFISGLLDLTDNIKEGKIISPPNVVCYDEQDPYLVVAADKGTATFSDIANSIAESYDYWLDDAFASGGSVGYDHKKMGITSKGVWVSVKRHFRELGQDPNRDDFTVVGIGDMAGDVFGNGMLLSNHTKLLAAFNHLHIFIDPNPDPESSFIERRRLFDLPRSMWTDYKPELISKGGGVFNRTAKTIKLSPEMKHMLQIEDDSLPPNELIRALIKAPVDLIWNGGIGTFVKSSQETHADVGDRSNDAIRVDGHELRAKIIAEGGNLGMTQLARIEYSLAGGIVNTDFIDNSAGVDCSDHEVNIKILLNHIIAQGVMTKLERNVLLSEMTQEVVDLVLLDNYDQTQMLSLETSVSLQTMDLFRHYMNDLELRGELNRKLEYLPDDKTLLERKASNKPLTRPEIAMLFAYSKMYLKRDILASSLPEDPFFFKYLLTAFPKLLADKYLDAMRSHSLKREIISTQLCKAITDRMGINFVDRLQRETGAELSFIVRAYAVATSIFSMEKLWHHIESLDYQVTQAIQQRMMLQIYYLTRRATRWFVRNRSVKMDIQKTIDEFSPSIAELMKELPNLLDGHDKEGYDVALSYLTEENVPYELATRIAESTSLFTSLDIIEASTKYELPLLDVAKTYYQLGNRLELNWVRDLMNAFVVENQWDELARAGFRDDLDKVQRTLCARVLSLKNKEMKNKPIEERIDYWINRHQFLVERWKKLLTDVKSSDTVNFVAYSVVLRELFDFAQLT